MEDVIVSAEQLSRESMFAFSALMLLQAALANLEPLPAGEVPGGIARPIQDYPVYRSREWDVVSRGRSNT